MKLVIAADHAGLPLKNHLVDYLKSKSLDLVDLGTDTAASVDYPDYAHRVATSIAQGEYQLGILVCGSGIGMSIAANRHSGVRAVVCSEAYSAKMSRMHNDANILCMGARVVGNGVAEQMVDSFLEAKFEGGRHQGRVGKIEL